ncbi:MAG: hypothetical protein KAJ28_06770 [Flavobacteriaceae bacterium]|nr:hypothetical protein [Flavobacteriaceae bacterium]
MKKQINTSDKNQIIPITLFFSVINSYSMIREYKKISNTLVDAVRDEINVIIKANDNETHKLNKVGVDNGSFYGFKKIKGKLVKTFININRISKVQISGTTLFIFYNVVW